MRYLTAFLILFLLVMPPSDQVPLAPAPQILTINRPRGGFLLPGDPPRHSPTAPL